MTDTTPDYAGIIAQIFDDLPTDDGGVPWGEVAKARDEATRIVRTLLERNAALERERDELKHDVSRYVEIASDEATRAEAAEARLAEALKALDLFEHYGCPVCHGDCSSANPPVDCCPMEAARRVRQGGKVDG